MKQKVYGTLASSKIHTETVDQLVTLPWGAVLQHHLKEENQENTRSDSDTEPQN